MPIEKSAGAVVFRKNREGKIEYLLLEHRTGNWNFPKGLIEKNEKLEETALREIKEETGLKDLEFIKGFKETIRYFFTVKYDYQLQRGFKLGQKVLKFATYFLAESKNREIRLSFEHQDYSWLTFDEAMKRLVQKNSKEILKKAYQFLINLDKNNKNQFN